MRTCQLLLFCVNHAHVQNVCENSLFKKGLAHSCVKSMCLFLFCKHVTETVKKPYYVAYNQLPDLGHSVWLLPMKSQVQIPLLTPHAYHC